MGKPCAGGTRVTVTFHKKLRAWNLGQMLAMTIEMGRCSSPSRKTAGGPERVLTLMY